MKKRSCFYSLSLCVLVSLSAVSCVMISAVEGRVKNLAARGEFDYAAQVFSRMDHGAYGKNNRLLEALDRGMIFHYAGNYRASIAAFENAKRIYDELYTESLSAIAVSWLWNDAALPYAGEDFERAMINAVQALNFIALEEYDEALVEARNAASVLALINDRYAPDQRNVYADDAFVRLLMGILYESFGEGQDMNNAFLSYRKAFQIYDTNYSLNYGVSAPLFLKEKLLLSSQWMGNQEYRFYQEKFSDIDAPRLKQDARNADVFLILYRGQIVNKVASSILLPGMDGFLTRVSFPKYRKAMRGKISAAFSAQNSSGEILKGPVFKVQDLDEIAKKNLAGRRARILAKAVARPVTKQLMLESLEDQLRDQAGGEAADLLHYAGNFYLLYSEQADLRGWETLPSEIFLGRLSVPPGEYRFFVNDDPAGSFRVLAGDKKFIMHWMRY